MQLHEFLSRVQAQGHLQSRDDAISATRATLATLSERIKGGEPRHLGSQLPQLLQGYLHEGDGERFDTEEFFSRVAEREGVDEQSARQHAIAVLRVVGEAVDQGEMHDVLGQLPESYHELFGQPTRPS